MWSSRFVSRKRGNGKWSSRETEREEKLFPLALITDTDFNAGELGDPLRDPCRLMEISQDQSGVLYNLFEYVIY